MVNLNHKQESIDRSWLKIHLLSKGISLRMANFVAFRFPYVLVKNMLVYYESNLQHDKQIRESHYEIQEPKQKWHH